MDNDTLDPVEDDPAAELKKHAAKADLEAAMYTGSSAGSACSETMEDVGVPSLGNEQGARTEPRLPFPVGAWSKVIVPVGVGVTD